jgi:putative polyketide hydroxylase
VADSPLREGTTRSANTEDGATPDHPEAARSAALVVGGGITGLSTALFLTPHLILAERHPSTAIKPQARRSNPRSMEIYRALGLAEEIRERQSTLVNFPENDRRGGAGWRGTVRHQLATHK